MPLGVAQHVVAEPTIHARPLLARRVRHEQSGHSGGVLERGLEPEARAGDLQEEDLRELLGRVVLEREDVVDAPKEAGVQRDELVHVGVVVPREDHHHVAPLHRRHELVDGLDAEVVVAAPREPVALVDEEDAAARTIDDGPRLDRRLPDVARDEIGALDLDERSPREDAELAEGARHEPRERGLAAARRPLEEEVRKRRRLDLVRETPPLRVQC
mmetsp:Transcript_1675/g.6467  ORF Transcript_1675/g.6467 Transcript_1675/m.6467 type:complete len:215 (+) Transcript_1675:268-912(+)